MIGLLPGDVIAVVKRPQPKRSDINSSGLLNAKTPFCDSHVGPTSETKFGLEKVFTSLINYNQPLPILPFNFAEYSFYVKVSFQIL